MKVTIVFDFPVITDPDSQEATDVIENLTALTIDQQNAWRMRFESDKVAVYVDDATGDPPDDCNGPSLEEVQMALFAAYDMRNTFEPEVLEMGINEASFGETVGSNLDDVIEFLEQLEDQLSIDNQEAA